MRWYFADSLFLCDARAVFGMVLISSVPVLLTFGIRTVCYFPIYNLIVASDYNVIRIRCSHV